MNWIVLINAITFNLLFCGVILLCQHAASESKIFPRRHSIIPGTDQPFMYWQDFYCQRIGCLFGLPLVLASYCHLMAIDAIPLLWSAAYIGIISGIGSSAFTAMCIGQNHKPDYGFPSAGKISVAGRCHSVYWGLMVAVSTICVWGMITGTLRGPMMWLALVGAVIYLASWACDVKAGHFTPIHLVHDDDEDDKKGSGVERIDHFPSARDIETGSRCDLD